MLTQVLYWVSRRWIIWDACRFHVLWPRFLGLSPTPFRQKVSISSVAYLTRHGIKFFWHSHFIFDASKPYSIQLAGWCAISWHCIESISATWRLAWTVNIIPVAKKTKRQSNCHAWSIHSKERSVANFESILSSTKSEEVHHAAEQHSWLLSIHESRCPSLRHDQHLHPHKLQYVMQWAWNFLNLMGPRKEKCKHRTIIFDMITSATKNIQFLIEVMVGRALRKI